jgi:hypothetical protein
MGASIVLSTLLHFSGRIHPSIAPAQLPATRKFFRCALLSPSPPYPSDTESMQDPDSKDVMTKKMCADMWAATEKNCEPGVTVPNNWINPQFAPPGWFQNLSISEITLIYGGLEVFRDDIDVIGHKLRVSSVTI